MIKVNIDVSWRMRWTADVVQVCQRTTRLNDASSEMFCRLLAVNSEIIDHLNVVSLVRVFLCWYKCYRMKDC